MPRISDTMGKTRARRNGESSAVTRIVHVLKKELISGVLRPDAHIVEFKSANASE